MRGSVSCLPACLSMSFCEQINASKTSLRPCGRSETGTRNCRQYANCTQTCTQSCTLVHVSGICPTRRVLRVSSKHYGVNREEVGSSRPIIMSKINPLDTREFRLGSVLWKKG